MVITALRGHVRGSCQPAGISSLANEALGVQYFAALGLALSDVLAQRCPRQVLLVNRHCLRCGSRLLVGLLLCSQAVTECSMISIMYS